MATDAYDSGAQATDIFPPFDPASFPSQLFWLAVTFGALYFVVSRVIAPRLGGALERRADKIDGDLKDAQAMNEKAVAAQEAMEKELSKARAEARETSAKAKADVEAEIAAENARVEAEVEARITQAATRLADVKAEALKNVEQVASATATAIVSRLTGVSISPEDAAAAVSATRKN